MLKYSHVLRINGEDIEFVDEDGNVIVASEESIIYVNRKGKEIDEKRAKRALDSGQYIDERSLYDDRYAPNSQRKQQQYQQSATQHRQQRQHQPIQSYNNKLSNHSTSDLIANMQKIFAEAHKNAQNQPDIGMIENDARSRSNTPPPSRHYQKNSYAAELNLQEQLKQLKETKKLQERQERQERHDREKKQREQQRQLEKKRLREYERQQLLQREEQQKVTFNFETFVKHFCKSLFLT